MGRGEQRRLANLEIHPAKGAGWSGGGAPIEGGGGGQSELRPLRTEVRRWLRSGDVPGRNDSSGQGWLRRRRWIGKNPGGFARVSWRGERRRTSERIRFSRNCKRLLRAGRDFV